MKECFICKEKDNLIVYSFVLGIFGRRIPRTWLCGKHYKGVFGLEDEIFEQSINKKDISLSIGRGKR